MEDQGIWGPVFFIFVGVGRASSKAGKLDFGGNILGNMPQKHTRTT